MGYGFLVLVEVKSFTEVLPVACDTRMLNYMYHVWFHKVKEAFQTLSAITS